MLGGFKEEAEFGPRAMGHRSILVDPRRNDHKDLLNKRLKEEKVLDLSAPSILEEYVEEYFVQNDEVPFMDKVFDVKRKNNLKYLHAHVDGTGRLRICK